MPLLPADPADGGAGDGGAGGAFGESYGPILALATGMFVLYGLLSLPQGWLAARFGRRG